MILADLSLIRGCQHTVCFLSLTHAQEIRKIVKKGNRFQRKTKNSNNM